MRRDARLSLGEEGDKHEADLKAIERTFAVDCANVELAALSSYRLWILALFAGVLGIGMLFGGNDAPGLAETLRLLAMLAAASAAFHVATWAFLRATIWLRDRRGN